MLSQTQFYFLRRMEDNDNAIYFLAAQRFLSPELFRRREYFGKTRSGPWDRFCQNIVKLVAILTIFRPFPPECLAWNMVNVLREKQGMSFLEHSECLVWNTGNVLLGTQ